MNEVFSALITETGQKKMINATVLGKKIELSSLAVGDGDGGYYEISEKQKALKSQVWEGALSKVFIDEDNPNQILIESYIPTDVGGFYIREAGVFDKDGDLIAIAKHPETYKPIGEFGAYKDITVRIILTLSNAANVVLKVNPSVVVATQKDLQDLIANIPNLLNMEDYQLKDEKGKVNGYAPLDANKKVPSEHLPVPTKGLQLGETEDTAYRGDRGKMAYDHSQKAHAPSNAYSKESMDDIIIGIKNSALQLGITAATAYRGDRGQIAYNHAQSKHADPNLYTNAVIDEMIEALLKEINSNILEQIMAFS